MAIADYVYVDGARLKQDALAKGYRLRNIVLGTKLNVGIDYLSHRLAKGTIPLHILKNVCNFVEVDYKDYLLDPVYDLTDVPTYQLQDELIKRGYDICE